MKKERLIYGLVFIGAVLVGHVFTNNALAAREVICHGEEIADLELVSVTHDGSDVETDAYQLDNYQFVIIGYDDQVSLHMDVAGSAYNWGEVYEAWAEVAQ